MEEPLPETAPTPKPAFHRTLQSSESRWALFVRFWHCCLWPGLLAVLVSAATSALAPWGGPFQPLPNWSQEDIGKPFSGAAPLKITRDVKVVDEVKTRAEREGMRDKELMVFDYDALTRQAVLDNLHEGFKNMRAFVQGEAEKPKATKRLSEEERQAGLRQAKDIFLKHFSSIEPEDLAALMADAFSESAENAVRALTEVAYARRLLASREVLLRANSTHIRIENEEALVRLLPSEVMDLQEAQTELERFASVPGNLLPEAGHALRRAVLRLAKRELRADLSLNHAQTEQRRASAYENVAPVAEIWRKGQKLIEDGETIRPQHLQVVAALKQQTGSAATWARHLGSFATVLLLLFASFVFFRTALQRFKPSSKDLSFLAALLLGSLVALFVWRTTSEALSERHALPLHALQALFPLATGAALVRFVLSEETALFFAMAFSAIAGILLGDSLAVALASLAVSCVASATIARAQDRRGIFKAGLLSGVLAFFVMFFWAMAEGKPLWEGFATGFAAMLGLGFGLPALVMALTPIVEFAFGYASDLKLLELANLNHPALKELIVRAPGTYHHSIVMGSLVESAAQAISANPLLARSCAYYHDIGKGKNPGYFAENQKGQNPHDSLSPAESAAIIKQHVVDGLALAKQHKLPRRVREAIPQHHGTRRIGYFFHKASTAAGEGAHVDERAFRYAGPKPQFREAALVMLADVAEAAARALPSPTPEALKNLVLKMVNQVFSEGQLDECELTLKDLHQVVDAFVAALTGIYHARPQYPAGAFKADNAEADPLLSQLNPSA